MSIQVLLIDDDKDFLDVAKKHLELVNKKITIDTLNFPEKIFQELERDQYDVIVTDYQMPVLDGLELIQKVKKRNIDIPIIIFTGKGREEVAVAALNLGVDFYLQKGSKFETVFYELSNFIEKAYESCKARKKLVESENIFSNLVEGLPFPIEVCDSEGTAVLVNQSFLNVFKVPSADLVVGKFNVFQDPSIKELGLLEVIKRVYNGETVSIPEIAFPLDIIEEKYKSRGSDYVYFEIHMFPIFSKTGELKRVVTVWTDVSKYTFEITKLKRDLEAKLNG